MKKYREAAAGPAAVIAGLCIATWSRLWPWSVFTAGDFGITTVYSQVDFNENGVDDYTDILLGARKDGKNHPKYDGRHSGCVGNLRGS